MPRVRELPAPDQFSARLKDLRRARNLSAEKLSDLAGLARSYLGNWERNPKIRPNPKVLAKVMDVLALSEAERAELVRLADARGAPDGLKAHYAISEADIHLRVIAALTEIDYDMPKNKSSYAGQAFAEAASWFLVSHPCKCLNEHNFTELAWPRQLYDARIINPSSRSQEPIPIPPELLARELPNLDGLNKLTLERARAIGDGMASIYRAWYLSDLERCRIAASSLRRWSLIERPSTEVTLSFTFDDVDVQDYNVSGVSSTVVATVLRRELAAFLYEAENARPRNDPGAVYAYRFGQVDWAAMHAMDLARRFVAREILDVDEVMFQAIHDALFVARSAAWRSPMFFAHACHFLVAAGDQENAARIDPRNKKSKAAQEEFLHRVIDTLEDAVRVLQRARERGGSTTVLLPTRLSKKPSGTAGSPKPRAGDTRATRKVRKAQRKARKPKGKHKRR